MKDAREQFFEGYGPMTNHDTGRLNVKSSKKNDVAFSGDDMLNRIEPRLRRLLIRACHNSYAAAKVVEFFESFIILSFSNVRSVSLKDGWWMDLLLECPTLTHRNDNHRSTAQFFFHPTLPTAGFHRLLLHAVCQFHGLNVVSRTEEHYECVWHNGDTTNGARVLKATGNVLKGTTSTSNGILLLQHIGENVDDSVRCIAGTNKPVEVIEERIAGLRI